MKRLYAFLRACVTLTPKQAEHLARIRFPCC